MVKCSVHLCRHRSDGEFPGISFHRFPLDERRKLRWVEAINREEGWVPSKWSAICSVHFLPSDFERGVWGRRHVKKDAVPSIGLCLEPQGTVDSLDFDKGICHDEEVTTLPSEEKEKEVEVRYLLYLQKSVLKVKDPALSGAATLVTSPLAEPPKHERVTEALQSIEPCSPLPEATLLVTDPTTVHLQPDSVTEREQQLQLPIPALASGAKPVTGPTPGHWQQQCGSGRKQCQLMEASLPVSKVAPPIASSTARHLQQKYRTGRKWRLIRSSPSLAKPARQVTSSTVRRTKQKQEAEVQQQQQQELVPATTPNTGSLALQHMQECGSQTNFEEETSKRSPSPTSNTSSSSHPVYIYVLPSVQSEQPASVKLSEYEEELAKSISIAEDHLESAKKKLRLVLEVTRRLEEEVAKSKLHLDNLRARSQVQHRPLDLDASSVLCISHNDVQ